MNTRRGVRRKGNRCKRGKQTYCHLSTVSGPEWAPGNWENTDSAIPQSREHQEGCCRASKEEPGSAVLEASSLSKIMGRKQTGEAEWRETIWTSFRELWPEEE